MQSTAAWHRSVLLEPSSGVWWMESHVGAACLQWEGSTGTALIGGRAADNRSRLGLVTLGLERGALQVLGVSAEPVLEVGDHSSFYRDGVSYPWRFQLDGEHKLLFTGWTRHRGSFQNHLGLAVWEPGFGRWIPAPGPLFPDERIGTGSSCFFSDQKGPGLLVTRFSGWLISGAKSIPQYDVWIARLTRGSTWQLQKPLDGLDLTSRQSVARPAVLQVGEENFLWLSLRCENAYTLIGGRLEGNRFVRDAQLDIPPSLESAWDSEMTEYAAPAIAGERLLALYNGNGFGKTGLGYAMK